MCSDSCKCCHIETEVADQICYLNLHTTKIVHVLIILKKKKTTTNKQQQKLVAVRSEV